MSCASIIFKKPVFQYEIYLLQFISGVFGIYIFISYYHELLNVIDIQTRFLIELLFIMQIIQPNYSVIGNNLKLVFE